MVTEPQPAVEATGTDPADGLSADVAAMIASAIDRHAFGPTFFESHLGAFVRDCCPKPEETLPVVELHLVSGAVIDVCHIIGLARQWAAVAAFDDRDSAPGAMRTELVPYAAILRVTIRPISRAGKRVGFYRNTPPALVSDLATPTAASAEDLLARSAAPTTQERQPMHYEGDSP